MLTFGIRFEGVEKLESELMKKSQTDFAAVEKKNIRDIFTRGQQHPYQDGAVPAEGGTPYDSGELRISLSYRSDETGYSKDYGPDVEFGHRTANGGFVPGQFFLKRNVEAQKLIYKQDLIDKLKE